MNMFATTLPQDTALRPCPLCNSRSSIPVFLSIRKCRDCGLRYVNPLGAYRGENETQEYFLNEYLPLHRNNWQNSVAERRAHLAMIGRFTSLPSHPRLLDVGCALGLMLREAKSAGWEATGVETSQFAADYAAEQTGCPVYCGTLQQAHFDADSFDVITLMDVIEHVPEPCELINEAYRVLCPGGVIFLVTPNFGSLFVRLLGARAYGIGPDEHVTCLQPSTMTRLLQKCGFTRTVTTTKDFYADNIRQLLGRSDKRTPADLKAAFGNSASLGALRKAANRILKHVPLGDKLIAMGVK